MGLRDRRYAHLRRRVQFVLHDSPGWWSALDPATGDELWRTVDPGTGIGGESCAFIFPGCTWAAIGIGFGYSAQGPVSAANGVVYACSLNPVGSNMYAMDAATGAGQVELRERSVLPRRCRDRKRHRLLGHRATAPSHH